MGNGCVHQLKIASVSGGRVDASLNSGDFKDGYFDPDKGTLKFTRFLSDGTPQYWSGHLMYHTLKDPQDPAHLRRDHAAKLPPNNRKSA